VSIVTFNSRNDWWREPYTDVEEPLPLDEDGPIFGEVTGDPLELVRACTPESRNNMVVMPPVVLHEGKFKKVVARITQFYRHDTGVYHHSKLELIYFKRNNTREEYRVVRKAPLDGQALEALIATLCSAPRFADIRDASTSLVVPVSGSSFAPEDVARLAPALGQLLSSTSSLDAVVRGELTPAALANLSAATQQARYKDAAAELRQMINDPQLSENIYQKWFENNSWVLGSEYVRRIPTREIDLHSTADILLVSIDGFVDIFELKKPNEALLLVDPSHKTYYPARPFAQALAQVMHYLRILNENRLRLEADWEEQVVRPRGILIIGRSKDWLAEQHQGWRNLTASLHNIDVLTYDHVLARMERIISLYDHRGPSSNVAGSGGSCDVPAP